MGAGTLGYDNVKARRTQTLGTMFRSQNYFRANRESHSREFMEAALHIRWTTMNKKNSHEILPVLVPVTRGNLCPLIGVALKRRRRGGLCRILDGNSFPRSVAPAVTRATEINASG
jgi:hypothetical protein